MGGDPCEPWQFLAVPGSSHLAPARIALQTDTNQQPDQTTLPSQNVVQQPAIFPHMHLHVDGMDAVLHGELASPHYERGHSAYNGAEVVWALLQTKNYSERSGCDAKTGVSASELTCSWSLHQQPDVGSS